MANEEFGQYVKFCCFNNFLSLPLDKVLSFSLIANVNILVLIAIFLSISANVTINQFIIQCRNWVKRGRCVKTGKGHLLVRVYTSVSNHKTFYFKWIFQGRYILWLEFQLHIP